MSTDSITINGYKYRSTGRLDDNGIEIYEGSIIRADGYGSDISNGRFYCVEYDEDECTFGSIIYRDFEPLERYQSIQVISHVEHFRDVYKPNSGFSGNIGAVLKTEKSAAERTFKTIKVKLGDHKTKYGPGVDIRLTSEDIAVAILEYVDRNGIKISGPRTVQIDGELCKAGRIYVDPLGNVETPDGTYTGRGRFIETDKRRYHGYNK